MKDFVKIRIEDDNGKILEHHYLRADEWGVPAGKIEANEVPLNAAVRELLERTGFSIEPTDLKQEEMEESFYVFKGRASDLRKIAQPGERGGYATSIRWV